MPRPACVWVHVIDPPSIRLLTRSQTKPCRVHSRRPPNLKTRAPTACIRQCNAKRQSGKAESSQGSKGALNQSICKQNPECSHAAPHSAAQHSTVSQARDERRDAPAKRPGRRKKKRRRETSNGRSTVPSKY